MLAFYGFEIIAATANIFTKKPQGGNMKNHLLIAILIGLSGLIMGNPVLSGVGFTFEQQPNRFMLSTDRLQIELTQQPLAFKMLDQNGDLILAQPLADGMCLESSGQNLPLTNIIRAEKSENGAHFICGVESGTRVQLNLSFKAAAVFELQIDARESKSMDALILRYLIQKQEHFYGFGERYEGYENEEYDQRGTQVLIWRKGTQGVYVPFYMSTAGYGLFVQNSEKGLFDMGKSDPRVLSIRYETKKLNWSIFYGPQPSSVLSAYSRFFGRPLLPPRWAFEPWKWRNEVKGAWELEADAAMLFKLNIPGRVMILDRPHFTAAMDFQFNPVQFSNIQKMLDELHRQGFRILLWVVPFVEGTTRLGREGLASGYFLKFKDGRAYSANDGRRRKKPSARYDIYFVDFSNPEAVRWWQRYLVRMLNLGFDGFKLDRSDEVVPKIDEVIFHNGKTAKEMYNQYATLYVKTFYDACQQARGHDFVIYSRPGYSGSQQYAAFFSGDTNPTWAHFRKNLVTILRAALSGFPMWGHEVGGYRCKDRFGYLPTKECFIRWTQFGAFSPIMDRGGLYFEEPWDYDTETVDIYRYYAKLHSELVPYILDCAHQANQTGLPIVRPLVLLYPHDPNVFHLDTQYLFGDAFLVAPIYDSTTSERDLYLPPGQWMNYWNEKEIHQGPQTITVNPPLEQLPLFIRLDSIIPMNVSDHATGHGAFFSKGHLTLDIYPYQHTAYKRRDETGEHPVTCQQTDTAIKLDFENNDQPLIIRVKCEKAPNQIRMNHPGQLTQFWKLHHLEKAEGWYYDQTDQRIWIKTHRMGRFEIVIDYQVKFTEWSYPDLTNNAKDGISISLKCTPHLKQAWLIYHENHSSPGRIKSKPDKNGRLEFMLKLGDSFQGSVDFYVEGMNRQKQMIRSALQSLTVDSDTTGPTFANWDFPDSVTNKQDFQVHVDIFDPSGVSKSRWGHAPLQIYWRFGETKRRSFGEKRTTIFREKNQNRYPRIKGDRFSFLIPAVGADYQGALHFYIEAWDYDDTPAKSISEEKMIYVQKAPSDK